MKKLCIILSLIASPLFLNAAAPADRRLGENLMQAVQEHDVDQVRQLLLAGANPSYSPRLALTILFSAIGTQNVEILGLLLDAGLDPNTHFGAGTALHRAAKANNLEMVDMLLGFGADASIENSLGQKAGEVTDDPAIQALINPARAHDWKVKAARKR